VPEPIRVAITFRVDDEVVERIRAVSPRIEIVDFPGIVLRPGVQLSDEEMARAKAALAQAEVVFGPNTLPAELVQVAANLKWFQVITAGVDRMVEDGLVGRHFTITKVTGMTSAAIAEYVIGMMLMLCKGLHQSVRDQEQHKWNFRFTAELTGKTCGIVGLGSIGRETAQRARSFGMRVVACRRRARPGERDEDCDALYSYTELGRVLEESDYVVVAVPLTAETYHLIGAAELGRMKRSASLVNIARGPVVDQDALVAALRDGTIASAALDVFDPEPLSAESPLWDMPNVIVTPHISGAIEGYGHRAAEVFVRNLRHYVAGEPLENQVDPVLAY